MTCWPLETLVHAEYKALTEYRDGTHPTEDIARDSWLRQMQTSPHDIEENVMRMRSLIRNRESVSECRVQLALCIQVIKKAKTLLTRQPPSSSSSTSFLRQTNVDNLIGHILDNLHIFLRYAIENEWMDIVSFLDRSAIVRRVSLRKSYFVDASKGTDYATTTVHFYSNDNNGIPFECCRYPGNIRSLESSMLRKARYVPSSGQQRLHVITPSMPIFHPSRRCVASIYNSHHHHHPFPTTMTTTTITTNTCTSTVSLQRNQPSKGPIVVDLTEIHSADEG